ncbi:hypothetical protein ABEW68_32175, partial [Paenibacillus lautus]|uniref:hypothetical protein n=1 Tax=Paenibacillus lautus TaxID=1401 RepID=UPI003D2BD296
SGPPVRIHQSAHGRLYSNSTSSVPVPGLKPVFLISRVVSPSVALIIGIHDFIPETVFLTGIKKSQWPF